MNPLAKHIERLLLEHSKVVVPSMGTFVVHNKALTSDGTGMFYIPSQDVSLIPDTAANDAELLIQSVANDIHCSYCNAADIVARWVEECQVTVQENGCCDLGFVGQLVMHEGEILFQPCRAGLPCSDFFGLDNLDMPLLPILTSQIKHVIEREEQSSRTGIIESTIVTS